MKIQENLHQEMEEKEITSTKSKQKQFDPNLKEELRKEGINPDMISEYGDVDFEDGIDDSLTYNDSFDEYGDDSYEY
tara:strand:+ start:80 stop:310 length:231 start_codon:yes stop_codon:yes gene_type:complete